MNSHLYFLMLVAFHIFDWKRSLKLMLIIWIQSLHGSKKFQAIFHGICAICPPSSQCFSENNLFSFLTLISNPWFFGLNSIACVSPFWYLTIPRGFTYKILKGCSLFLYIIVKKKTKTQDLNILWTVKFETPYLD